jgi:adenylate cyclase
MTDGEIRVPSLPPISVDPLMRKWVSYVDTPIINLSDISLAQDKYVIIGTSGGGILPQVPTPNGLMNPHHLQAALAESILLPNSPKIPEWHLASELLIFTIFILLAWYLTQKLSMTVGLIGISTSLVVVAIGSIYTIKNGVLIDVTWTLISQFIVGSVSYYLKFREQYKLRQQIKKQFEHYLDPRQVKALQSDPSLLKLGGEKKRCTFLFTDVRGFTAMSEHMDPEQVTQIMNQALTIQSDAVKKYEGMVDKYIGDAMMAIFNAPIDLQNHEQAAVECAKEIQKQFAESDVGVSIGIGINTGEAVIGNMGSNTRFDYSAIGSAVNIAARCESSCKTVGKDLIIAEETAKNCNFELKSLQPIEVKGISEPLKIFTLEDL